MSTPSDFQGSFAGSFSASTSILSPQTTSLPATACPEASPQTRCTVSYFKSTPARPAGAGSDDPSGGSVRAEGILVVVDNVRQGGVEALRTIETERILEIRHLSASEAYDLYGSDQAGVIVIKTGRADTKP